MKTPVCRIAASAANKMAGIQSGFIGTRHPVAVPDLPVHGHARSSFRAITSRLWGGASGKLLARWVQGGWSGTGGLDDEHVASCFEIDTHFCKYTLSCKQSFGCV